MKSAIQLYTLRDIDEPLPNVIRRVGDAGFDGVEFANRLPEADPDDVVAALAEADVEPIGAHVGLRELEANPGGCAARYAQVGVRRLAIPHLPLAHYRTPKRIDALARRLDDLGARLADHGVALLYHNQVHDFVPLRRLSAFERLVTAVHPYTKGCSKPQTAVGLAGDRLHDSLTSLDDVVPIERTAFGRLVDATDDDYVSFEVDVGAATAAGQDPRDVLSFAEPRTPLVHFKDTTVSDYHGPLADWHSVDPNTGDVDFDAALEAAEDVGAEWAVFEHDAPDDPILALRQGSDAFVRSVRRLSPGV
ncbi:sugar phosphate isomerase/epimerase family protein [Halomarina oriensis]|uniref:Sugar phosphate isomerase/epimerase n=1 Tax=Halomarina oriensis TaxID=671145 RepID=A0A6B0GGW2_9EURY|nr:sugar phosphate isomerase/epimerase [Halomarina oriensis]MWG33197.1 sugar phosphate isomerase/epimerase [Halomarina oriensis]